jgi:hypothetical protein
MIRALLLIFDGSRTWERIKADQAGVAGISLRFLLPLLLLTAGAEVAGLTRFGAERGSFGRVVPISLELALQYEAVHVIGLLLLIYLGALLLQNIGASFHRRHSYTECFTTLCYSLSPLLLMRIPDAFPSVPSWACYGVGIFLAVCLLYRGVPTILKPDPSNALGLYMLCAFLLIAATGIIHFVSTLVLSEQWTLRLGSP